MASTDQRTSTARRKAQPESLPFTRTNYQILLAGLVTIAAGYFAMSQPPWDGTMPLVVAPILLVVGYCVIIPVGILYRKRNEGGETSALVESGETRKTS